MSMFDEGISVAFRKGLQSMQNCKISILDFYSFQQFQPLQTQSPTFNHALLECPRCHCSFRQLAFVDASPLPFSYRIERLSTCVSILHIPFKCPNGTMEGVKSRRLIH